MPDTKPLRKIRSYVLRNGRLTSGQAHALEYFWPEYGIDNNDVWLDLNKEFSRTAPRILDIGVGMGDTSIKLALANPENDYLAVDVHLPGVGSLLRQAKTMNIKNIRIICNDIVEVLSRQIPDHSIDQTCIYFPDPWPKKRHHKRRLISTDFLNLLIPKLKNHGRIFIATDWQDLAEHILSICDTHGGLVNLAGPGNSAPRPRWRPLTKFEQRGKNLNHSVFDFVYCLARPGGREKN